MSGEDAATRARRRQADRYWNGNPTRRELAAAVNAAIAQMRAEMGERLATAPTELVAEDGGDEAADAASGVEEVSV